MRPLWEIAYDIHIELHNHSHEGCRLLQCSGEGQMPEELEALFRAATREDIRAFLNSQLANVITTSIKQELAHHLRDGFYAERFWGYA